ncbi:ABC transporter permease [Nonomuraea sp. NPDC003754]
MTDRLAPTRKWARRAVGVFVFAGAFELLGRAGLVDSELLPPTSEVLRQAVILATDSAFLRHAATSLLAWLFGMGLAVAIGVPLGLLLGSIPAVNTATRAIVEFLRPIPSVALIPLVALLIGTGLQLRVTLIVYAALWPVLYNTVYGLHGVDRMAKESLRAFGFGRLAVLWRVCLPYSAPFITTGIRLAAGVAVILTISTEIVAGRGDGIGIFISLAGTVPGRMNEILASVVWVGFFGVTMNALLVSAERRFFHWHHAQAGGPS